MKKILSALGLAVLASLIFLTHRAMSTVDLTNQNMADSTWLGWGTNTALFYGSSAANYFRIRVNGTDQLNVAGALVGIGTTAPVSKLDVSGGMSVGSYAATNAAPTNGAVISGVVGIGTSSPGSAQLAVTAANASSSGTVVNSAASSTADLIEAQSNGTNVLRVNASGLLASPAVLTVIPQNASSTSTIVTGAGTYNNASSDLSQWNVGTSTRTAVTSSGSFIIFVSSKAGIDSMVPARKGELVQCGDCNIPFNICMASGTAIAQYFAVIKSTAFNGGGNGTSVQFGCGSGQ